MEDAEYQARRADLLRRYPDADERMSDVYNLLLSASKRAQSVNEPSSEPENSKATRATRKPKAAK